MDYLKKLDKLLKNNGLVINAEKIVNLINKMNEKYIIEDSLQNKLKIIHNNAFDFVIMKYTEPEKYKTVINIRYKLWFLFTDQKVIVCTSFNYIDILSTSLFVKFCVLKNSFQNWFFNDDYKLNCINKDVSVIRGTYAASEHLGISLDELYENIQNAIDFREHRQMLLKEMNRG